MLFRRGRKEGKKGRRGESEIGVIGHNYDFYRSIPATAAKGHHLCYFSVIVVCTRQTTQWSEPTLPHPIFNYSSITVRVVFKRSMETKRFYC
jgi:hypothetical protein